MVAFLVFTVAPVQGAECAGVGMARSAGGWQSGSQ